MVREYVWLNERPIAVIDDVDTNSPKLYFVHVDHLGRPVLMTDASKAVVWEAVFEPFGAVHAITGSASLNARFPGQWFMLESGLHYNWHRYYDPTTGRYTAPDPLGFVDGPSVYGYAGGSPLMYVDPDGRVLNFVVLGAIGFGIGADLEYLTNPCASLQDIIVAGAIGAATGAASGGYFLRFGAKSLTRETGKEWSHSVAKRVVDKATSGGVRSGLNRRGGLNGSWVSPKRHLKHDPHRYPRGNKQMGRKYSPWLQGLDRIPDWLKGAMAGGLGGSLLAGEDCTCR